MCDRKPILPPKACPRLVPNGSLTLVVFIILLAPISGMAQPLTGTWALANGTDCAPESSLDGETGPPPKASIVFHENQRCELSGLDLFDGKPIPKTLLFKRDGGSLYFLDKRSQTLASVFTIEKLTADSLILSDSSRPCLIKIFVRRQHP